MKDGPPVLEPIVIGGLPWFPIATAPKDGRSIFVVRHGSWVVGPLHARWHEERGWIAKRAGKWAGTIKPFTLWSPHQRLPEHRLKLIYETLILLSTDTIMPTRLMLY